MNRPQVGVTVVIVKDGKIALGKRLKAYGYGQWQFAGGHLEMNETPEECAIRETFEETGLTVKNPKFLYFKNVINKEHKTHYCVLVYGVEWESGEFFISEEEKDKVEAWEWFDLDKVPSPRFEEQFDDFKHINKYIKWLESIYGQWTNLIYKMER